MKKLIKILALSLCIGTAATLTSCVELVHPKYFSYSLSEPALVIEYAEVGTAEEFATAILAGENVKLTESLQFPSEEELEQMEISKFEIARTAEITINLNGYNLSSPDETTVCQIGNLGALTLTGNGTVSNVSIVNLGEMIVEEGVTIELTTATENDLILNMGNLHIKGGTFKNLCAGEENDINEVSCLNNQANSSVTIDGGLFQNDTPNAFAITSSGEMTINNATVLSQCGAVEITGGTATVENGTFYASKYYGLFVADSAETTVNGGNFFGVEKNTDVYVDAGGELILNGGTMTNNKIVNLGTIVIETGSSLSVDSIENKENGTITDNRVAPEEPETPEGGEGEPEGDGENAPEGGEGENA